ncbi:MAG: ASPIC/UnbV domain-containing protein, partial [Saprospiraceae bacterium]|nr:ASPIC/UnbV domain-containing protein [Saprospiraceae bacterium]
NSLYRIDGGDVFTSIQNDATDDGGLSFGTAWADYDRDGDLDLFVANRKNSGNFFYKNTRGTCNAWTSIKLVGTGSNRSAIGARVTLTAIINGQTVTQTREVQGQSGGGTGGQNDMTLSFGLGNATTINSIVVRWPSGYRQTLINQLVNQRLTITEDNLSEVSGQVYYEENLVCSTGLPTPPAASQSATYRTANAGDWSSPSTWAGGSVPAFNSINNRTISIEHDVTIPSGSIYITGTSTQIWITNAKLKMTNGNLTMDRGSLRLLGATLEMNNGNFDITGATAYFNAVQSSVTVSGNHTCIGKKRWENACIQVTGSYVNAGPDTLTNVKMDVRGNFQNYISGNMVVNNARIHVTNGEFQNLSPSVVKGSGLVIWLETGNIQNYAIWTATISQYCTPSWATPVGILAAYLPSAKNCATIAAQFVDSPCTVTVSPSSVVNRVGIPYAKVIFQPGDIAVYADENGFYSAFLPAGSYTMQQNTSYNFQAKCPNTTGTQNVTISGAGQVYASRDFGSIPMSTLPDLFTEVVTTAHRIGAHNLLMVNYENMGLSASENTILEVQVPSDIEILLTSIPQLPAKASSLSFDLGTVPANGKGVVFISYSLPTGTPVGKTLTVTSNINGSTQDANTANNISTNTSNSVAAYDPNDISVSPSRYVKRDEWINYKIRFQNVGNFPAGQVRVEDELPEGLDISTLELGGVSHTYRLQVQGRKLIWTFPNINLPDSLSNEQESHGYISFRIKAKESLTLGDRMLNRAAIFFDNLEPVITNTVESILTGEITKETRLNAQPLQMFPNPSSGKVTVQSFDLNTEPDAFFIEISVFDQFGRQVFLAKDIASQRQELALYELTAGNYYVKALDSKGRVYTGTIVLLKN